MGKFIKVVVIRDGCSAAMAPLAVRLKEKTAPLGLKHNGGLLSSLRVYQNRENRPVSFYQCEHVCDGSARCTPFRRSPLLKGLTHRNGYSHRFEFIKTGKTAFFLFTSANMSAMAPLVARLLGEAHS
ncbi:hypothetical protein [Halalkalibacter alkaliphilus]|uniref:Uncharacterized protein n=1 Tax=Halalkalibacter alkaliphilus TaxID=2917993 RepID=A0A9X2CPM6_9BACI|nr:hypothetical protein [Halalkalibacter alkaliphilus]MCL7746382.1 hypothetical protein [Halalkalibacter alkaliphilus]